ncbi:helix-turn-helix domain-containing protein [Paenibacillus aurantiacus]|uniref:Helix-turn-helix domain-containing protein n=1 Tax=Paenibacillus aurantiacus TaxID=1936118 RepID=A0ABV5KR06_9BACL
MESFSLFDEKWRLGDYRPQLDAYYYRQWIDFHMNEHAHPQVEIMYVISGRCIVETREQAVELGGGDFIVLDSWVPHRLVVNPAEPCRMLNVEFTFAPSGAVAPSMRQLAETSPALRMLLERRQPWFVLSDPSDVQITLRSLVLELDGHGGEREILSHLMIGQLLLQIARLYAEHQRSGLAPQTDRYVRQAVQYILQHYDCECQAKDVAAHVKLHPVYLQRIFRKQMGISMASYIIQVRMDKAKMLLGRTAIPIADIADYVGINSRQYFNELFKRTIGQTPAAYRRSVELVGWDKK